MRRYAQNTSVPVEQSRNEIEQTLARYGATEFCYAMRQNKAAIEFIAHKRRVRFVLPLPDQSEPKADQKRRQKWRALLLSVKAKLEAVASGIATFESEFLANIVLPNSQTVDQWLAPQIEQTYKDKQMPGLLLLDAPK